MDSISVLSCAIKKNIYDLPENDFSKINRGWMVYRHYNENKRGNKEYINDNYALSDLTKYLNSDKFLLLLEKLSG